MPLRIADENHLKPERRLFSTYSFLNSAWDPIVHKISFRNLFKLNGLLKGQVKHVLYCVSSSRKHASDIADRAAVARSADSERQHTLVSRVRRHLWADQYVRATVCHLPNRSLCDPFAGSLYDRDQQLHARLAGIVESSRLGLQQHLHTARCRGHHRCSVRNLGCCSGPESTSPRRDRIGRIRIGVGSASCR